MERWLGRRDRGKKRKGMSDHAFFVLPVNGSRLVRFDSAQRPGMDFY